MVPAGVGGVAPSHPAVRERKKEGQAWDHRTDNTATQRNNLARTRYMKES